MNLYKKHLKRILDIIISLVAIICLSWLLIIVAVIVRIKIGSPVVFIQPRPGRIDKKTGKERIFDMYKFRTMTNKTDNYGQLLPDNERLIKTGVILRKTSLDELPELFNVLRGDMSLIGPRPQLIRDMVFMSDKQRLRHTVRPGITGLAQVNGRNAISWEKKLEWDLKYVRESCFKTDLKILLKTIKKVFGRNESEKELDITDDFGDALLKNGNVSKEEYDALQLKATQILNEHLKRKQR